MVLDNDIELCEVEPNALVDGAHADSRSRAARRILSKVRVDLVGEGQIFQRSGGHIAAVDGDGFCDIGSDIEGIVTIACIWIGAFNIRAGVGGKRAIGIPEAIRALTRIHCDAIGTSAAVLTGIGRAFIDVQADKAVA